jgi:hypothetical protein
MEIGDIEQQVKMVLDPMASRLGLRGPIRRVFTHTSLSIAYMSGDLGVEINIDLSDFFLFALLFKATGQEIPVGYEDENGRRQKVYLQHALERLGRDVTGATKVLQKLAGDYRNCESMARIISDLLEPNWPLLTRESHAIFSPS